MQKRNEFKYLTEWVIDCTNLKSFCFLKENRTENSRIFYNLFHWLLCNHAHINHCVTTSTVALFFLFQTSEKHRKCSSTFVFSQKTRELRPKTVSFFNKDLVKVNNKGSIIVFVAVFAHFFFQLIHDCWYWYTITLLK